MKYVYEFSEGGRDMRELLGGKGANIAEMTRLLGADRVPAGFTITTEACVAYMRSRGAPEGLDEEVDAALAALEERAGKRLGDREDPLLVSVRSGARVSMPGMLETVLNLGLNDDSVRGLAERTGNERFAWDSYRRFVQMFGDVVRDVPGSAFEDALRDARRRKGVEEDTGLGAGDLRELTGRFKRIFADHAGEEFPAEPRVQLRQAILAVFDSWNGDRAVAYRRMEGIPDDWGTGVNVQQMVFGNKGDTSGSGVAFSRDERTGEPRPSGDFLLNAQGEDVVAGVRTPEDLASLGERLPDVHAQLLETLEALERHYGDMQDVEFTVEQGRLYLLQTRNAKRPAQAAVRFAHDAVGEGLLSREDALRTIDADSLDALLHPVFDPAYEYEPLTRGVAASPGAARGAIVLSAAEAIRRAADGEDVILVRQFTEADDVGGFHAARGILTAEGGKASHAALVARGMGRPCVAGASEVVIDEAAGVVRVGAKELRAGDEIAIEGSSGAVTDEEVPLIAPEMGEDFLAVLRWADGIRALGVRANADTPEDAAKASEFGAEGIGLCRTEHMFFGEDRGELVRGMFIAAERWRRARNRAEGDGDGETGELEGAEAAFRRALDSLEKLQRGDFRAIFHEMAGRPVTIRLLDPPLHEFLPLEHFEAVVRELEGTDEGRLEQARAEAEIARDLEEVNPMLGTRGVRLAVLYPPLYAMQVRAIVAAAGEAAGRGDAPHAEIMLPLVAYERELELLREFVVEAAREAQRGAGADVAYSVGTMVELPRACLIAERIARHADFFSFGTNDLTQTTLGFSRDDVEGSFMPRYLDLRVIDRSPFETIDVPGVGELVRIGAERGRGANEGLKLGVCGEHGGDPDSIGFFDQIGVDYVSCSPFRVPIARVAAAQAALARPEDGA
ncbi:MAG TPA: pyruvate, phosphate dikinase [Solirubrobacterales bacterium]|nr:pyruvate, phosphate dikinase [Solirubrobacterales bacterium]